MNTQRRILIFSSNWGREAGWEIFADGMLVLTLNHPGPIEDFWFRYDVEVIDANAKFEDPDFWIRPDIRISSCLTGESVSDWIISPRDGYIWARNLHLDPGFPRFPLPWEWIMMKSKA